ncbi:MAG: FKBP-type peptidyl-prolyl cis-trans isomerase [Bacteroidota bacterium]
MRRALLLLPVLLLALPACDSNDGPDQTLVTVAYEGRLADGTVFDSSAGATFILENTIPGFFSNVITMEVGETKTFEVPPEEGYGATPVRDSQGDIIIPANSTLTFEVTLIARED